MTTEVWRDIEGYEGIFQVSNLGRVKSLPRVVKKRDGKLMNIKGKIRKPHETKDGYLRVRLAMTFGESKSFLVHRLVANAFIPNPENKSDVNHKDENKKNNYIENLEWTSHKENCDHSSWYYEKLNQTKYAAVTVRDFKGNNYTFKSIKEMANSLNIKIPTAHTYVQKSRILSRGKFEGWYFGYEKIN